MSEHDDQNTPRQHIERVRGGRRARLTPAPGTDPAPDVVKRIEEPKPAGTAGDRGPNDEQLRRDVPPHY